MSEIWELAYEDYNKGLKYKEIAEKYNVPIGTIKSWKSRKWSKKELQPRINKSCNQKRIKGGQQSNKNAEKHGLYSKYLPYEALDIFEDLETINPLDMIWDNIKIQYTAILRAQKIMYVKEKEEMIKELKKEKESETGLEVEYEFQFAWDRQATFLNSQSRAMGTLSNLIKQYDEMLNKSWDLATKEQKFRIEKLKNEIDKNKDTTDKDITVTVKKASERDES